MKLDRITAVASKWHSKGHQFPVIRLVRNRPGGQQVLAAPLDYKQARALVDRIHDLVDDYERNQIEQPPTVATPQVQSAEQAPTQTVSAETPPNTHPNQ
ncbi:hypothetical protein [Gulosibacter sediminis]|uniref:hypothetical protein n=1 Tax=Gulosibacter sediminis TaxID=1729695 RepID=UPI0024A9204C|nr:hypothetical protein [Gulosibacter sediminis]